MNYTFRIINYFKAKKKCVINFKIFPSGTVHLGISDIGETKNHLFDCATIEELDEVLKKKFPIDDVAKPVLSLPSAFPKPPGLPKI